jgi:hypothetical protein
VAEDEQREATVVVLLLGRRRFVCSEVNFRQFTFSETRIGDIGCLSGVETQPCLATGGIDTVRIGVQKGPKRKAGIELDPGLPEASLLR